MSKYTVPKIWGPYYWFVMRSTAFNYSINPDETEIKQTKNFFISLQYILPCKMCKKSYAEHLQKYSLDAALKNKNTLMEWVELIYNETQKSKSEQKIESEQSKYDNKHKINVQKQQNYTKVVKTPEKQEKVKISRTVVVQKQKPQAIQKPEIKVAPQPQPHPHPQPQPQPKSKIVKDNIKIIPIQKVDIKPLENRVGDINNRRITPSNIFETIKRKPQIQIQLPLPQVEPKISKVKNNIQLVRERKKFSVTKRCNCGK